MDFACTHCDRLVGVGLRALIMATGTLRYAFQAVAKGAMAGTKNPVPVSLAIGDDSSTTSVKAEFDNYGSLAMEPRASYRLG